MVKTPSFNQKNSRPIVVFFLATCAISWVLWIPMALSSQGVISIQVPPILGIVVGGMSPSFVAVVLITLREGNQGVRDLFARLLRWRVAIYWYLFALCAPAAIMLCAIVLNTLLDDTSSVPLAIGNWGAVVALFLFTLVLGGPLGEELGWRGFLLPRLLVEKGALTASMIVGVLWGVWHLPLFWVQASLQADIPMGWFMISLLAESVLYTWMHLHTRGSLLPILLLHAAVNTWAKLILLPRLANNLRPLLFTFGLEILLAIIVVVWAKSMFFSKPGAKTSS